MTDTIREFETLVAQNPTAAHYAVPRDMALALLAGMTPTAPNDLLNTVKAALVRLDTDPKCPETLAVWWMLREGPTDVVSWLRALVARVEQAEAQVAMLCSDEPCPKCGYGVAPICYGCLAKAAEAENARLRQALRTIIAERARNLEATCPGEHDYEPDCTHGVNHCPIIATAKAALARREP